MERAAPSVGNGPNGRSKGTGSYLLALRQGAALPRHPDLTGGMALALPASMRRALIGSAESGT